MLYHYVTLLLLFSSGGPPLPRRHSVAAAVVLDRPDPMCFFGTAVIRHRVSLRQKKKKTVCQYYTHGTSMTLEKKVTRRKPASRPAGRRALEPLESLYARLTPVPVVVRRRGTLTRLLLRLQLYSDDDNYIVVVVSLIECRAAERRVYDAYCPVYACAVGKRPVPARIRGPPIAPPPSHSFVLPPSGRPGR